MPDRMMTMDEALIILSEGNAGGKFRIARSCGDMVRAQTQAMQIARECIKRCRDFHEIEDMARMQETIRRMYDILDDVCKDIRERYGQDDVCGLCQYDGAYMTDSGDYANECPGFERDDCFTMKNEIRELCGVERLPEPYDDFVYEPADPEEVEFE